MSTDTYFHRSDLYFQHDTGGFHPERPERLEAVYGRMEACGYLRPERLLGDRYATPEEIQRVHTEGHLRHVQKIVERGGGPIDPDTMVSPRSLEAALLAAGSGLAAVEGLLQARFRRAFLPVRPPGHHAMPDYTMGFCLFNNLALAVRHLQHASERAGGEIPRVAIVDFDVHHGNGTEAAFYDDPRVLFISLHEYPHYPGTGPAEHRGSGIAEGFNLNVPLAPRSGKHLYSQAFTQTVEPALHEFAPDFLFLSAGFDAHRDDPLASMALHASDFGWMTRRLSAIADQYCGGRMLSFLEGGYELSALADSVEAHLDEFVV